MDTYMVVLRIVHILAGVFWVGAVFVDPVHAPTARELGPPAVLAHLAGKKRVTEVILAAAGLTILAGADVLAGVGRAGRPIGPARRRASR